MAGSFVRKMMTGVVTFAMAGALLAGCAQERSGGTPSSGSTNQSAGANKEKETIEFVYWAGAGGEEEAFRDLVAKFEAEHPDIKVNAVAEQFRLLHQDSNPHRRKRRAGRVPDPVSKDRRIRQQESAA